MDGHFSGRTVASPLDAIDPRVGRFGKTVRQAASLCLILLPVGFTEPVWSPIPLVSSYRTVSPLPVPRHFHVVAIGGLLSAALSLFSRTVGVTHHRLLWSPDFPPATEVTSDRPTHSAIKLYSLLKNRHNQFTSGSLNSLILGGTPQNEVMGVVVSVTAHSIPSFDFSTICSKQICQVNKIHVS